MLPFLELPIINYFGYKFFADQLFGDLLKTSSHSLVAVKQPVVFQPNSTIIEERQNQRGIYILRKGKARVVINPLDGNTKVDRKVEKNEVLGLCATISDLPYEFTVETIAQCQTDFISGDNLISLISKEEIIRNRLIHLLSDALHCTYCDLRSSRHSRMLRRHFRPTQTKQNKTR
jgi:CRP-like cAMP-binding protein